MASGGFPPYFQTRQTPHKRWALTLGEFCASVYHACGRKKAKGMVRLAMKARLVEFRRPRRFMIS